MGPLLVWLGLAVLLQVYKVFPTPKRVQDALTISVQSIKVIQDQFIGFVGCQHATKLGTQSPTDQGPHAKLENLTMKPGALHGYQRAVLFQQPRSTVAYRRQTYR